MSDEDDQVLQGFKDRKREGWFQSEDNRQRILQRSEPEPTYDCPRRIGVRFVPHTASERLRLVTVLCCEDRNHILLRNVETHCWACPGCELEVEREVADVLARESIKALQRFRKADKQRVRRKWWHWRNWFRSKKRVDSSVT